MKYDPLLFVQDGYQKATGEYSEETKGEIKTIRNAHPELADWGDLAIGSAWGDYSQDMLLVNWCDWLISERNEEFLRYITDKS